MNNIVVAALLIFSFSPALARAVDGSQKEQTMACYERESGVPGLSSTTGFYLAQNTSRDWPNCPTIVTLHSSRTGVLSGSYDKKDTEGPRCIYTFRKVSVDEWALNSFAGWDVTKTTEGVAICTPSQP
jgi:hypothetical protein